MVDKGILCWNSENVITPRFMYGEDKWPRIVKAAGGHYGVANCETFSAGDEMVMIGRKGFPRLIAHNYKKCQPDNAEKKLPLTVALDAIKQKGLGYSIPLMLTDQGHQLCMVQILPLRRSDYVYKTAQELLETFPRFVKVNRSFSIHPRQPMIKKGSVLELLQTDLRMEAEGNGPSKFLICACHDRRIPLKMDTWGDFTVDDDPCQYTLMEVVERFPLPQRVHFSSMPKGLKTNDIILFGEVNYDVLISIPMAAVMDEALVAKMDFDIIYFPVGSEVEFIDCSSNRFSNAYQKVIQECSKNFGMGHFKDVNEVCKEVSMLEIQFHPYERVYENLQKRCPPAIPEKPKRTPGQLPPALPSCDTLRHSDEDSDCDRPVSCYDEAGNWIGGSGKNSSETCPELEPPALPPKPHIQNMLVRPTTIPAPKCHPSPPLVSISDRPVPKSFRKGNNYFDMPSKVVKKIGEFFQRPANGDAGSPESNNDCNPSDQDCMRDIPGSSDSSDDEYDYPKDMEVWLGVPPGCQDYVNQPPSTGPMPQEVVNKIFKKTPVMLSLKRSTSSTSCIKKQGSFTPNKKLADFSVEEVGTFVREAGQVRIAAILEENMVDGDFFKTLRTEQLSCAPFNASPFEIEALKRIQKGKLPKRR